MAEFHIDKIRNIALIGHSGEGKTSLMEAILFVTKAIDRLGKVDEGTSVSDYDQEEISRHISISLSAAYTTYKDYKINILDVPGFFDFEGEMVAALTVADAAIIVTNATGSLAVGAEKAIDYCLEKGKAMLLFVNGVNKENSDYLKTIDAFQAKYGNKILPIELPIMNGTQMEGFVDVFESKAYDLAQNEIPVPTNLTDKLAEYENSLLEIAAEADDALLEKYFEGGSLTVDERKNGIKTRIVVGEIIPAVAGVAVGAPVLTKLLDNIIDLYPAADQGAKLGYSKEDGSHDSMVSTENGKFAAKIFKTIVDPFVGKLLLFKLIRGKVSIGEQALNADKDETEKITALYCLRGKKQDIVDTLYAGDIGAFAKLNHTSTNDTLCNPSDFVKFDPIDFPQPVISFSVSASDKNMEEKVIAGFTKLLEEDVTFRLEKSAETNEMLLSGMGEMQLDILSKKVKNKYNVEAVLTEPRVAYHETIRKTVEAEGKHKKQSGGAGQFGQCLIRFEPGAEDGMFEFVDAIVGGAIPRQFIPAVEKGLREAIKKGVLAGYPMYNLKCTVFDGKYHPVDSKEIAFISAAKLAYADGCGKASPVFLEPIMSMKITVPESYMGDIMGDMNKRRGRILGMESENGKTVINAEVPQAEVSRYATDLRSMTQGRGKFASTLARYEEVPAMLAPKIIEDAKKRAEAEK
ncbi:MAG: elongation factor G [Clostridia bacterium]|nr:elongation factor G [Clostridia bacterium]